MPNQNITTLFEGIEVQYSKLGDVGEFVRGKRFVKTDMISEGVPCIHYGQMYTHYGVWADKTKSFVSPELVENKKLRKAEKGDVVIVAAGETIEDIGMGTAWLSDESVVIHDACFFFKSELDPKYVAYFTRTDSFSNQIRKSVSSGKISAINAKGLSKIEIPIPCPENPKKSLEIQAEIVRILDTFTELTAKLTVELTARKKQYNHYRDQLLSFEEGEVEWKTLGDVTKKWYSGGTPTAGNPEYYNDGDIPWLRTKEVKFSDIERTEVKVTQAALDNSSARWIPANCVIIAISGATAGRSAINKIPLTTNQHCGCMEIDSSKALYHYVFYWVSCNYENIKSLGQGARGDLNSSIIKNFKLPIPFADDPEKSLTEQARIVTILNKFDALTNSISEGLPREIELRQKQYEYYRDLLLSFPKPDSEVAA
jgi:type I restriction enzyme S subunit